MVAQATSSLAFLNFLMLDFVTLTVMKWTLSVINREVATEVSETQNIPLKWKCLIYTTVK